MTSRFAALNTHTHAVVWFWFRFANKGTREENFNKETDPIPNEKQVFKDGHCVGSGRKTLHLETKLGKGLVGGSQLSLNVLGSLSLELVQLLLGVVESGRLDLALSLQSLDQLVVRPAHLGRELAQDAELAARSQTDNAHGIGDDLALDLIEGVGDTLEDLEALQSGGTTSGLVGDHATNDTPQDTRGSTEVDHAAVGVGVHATAEESLELELVAEQRARDVDLLSANQNDLLAVQELLGDIRSQAAHHVALAIDNDDLLKHRWLEPKTLTFGNVYQIVWSSPVHCSACSFLHVFTESSRCKFGSDSR